MINIFEPPHCVQCAKEMVYGCDIQKINIPVCSNPGCPNYGLLQIGREGMDKIKIKESLISQQQIDEIMHGLNDSIKDEQ
jgi:hypothetical protein